MSLSDAFERPRMPLQHRCASCDAIHGDSLMRCAGCRLVRYCSRDHQIQHRPLHKSLCKKINRLREKLEREESLVRHASQDFLTPANAFETHVGRFWGLLNTRDYMRARFALADEAHRLGTLDGVKECLDHFQDMIRLNRSDNMGLRDKVPALLLRLHRDQDCYDFIKWWETGTDMHYDWGNMELPFLDIKDADVMEDPNFLLHRSGSLSFLVAALLLKVKMLVDIRNIKVARKVVSQRLPFELWAFVEKNTVQSPLSQPFLNRRYKELIEKENILRTHCCLIGAAIVQANNHFMYELLDLTEETMLYRPGSYTHGSYEEMALVMQDSYPAWCEIVGALDFLEEAQACAARDSENEIEDLQKNDKERRTAERLLEDISTNRIWGYLDYAIENGSYLGPAHKRPSERYTQQAREAWAEAVANDEEDSEDDDFVF